MSSNIDIFSADISIFDDIAIFVMSFEKKWKLKRFFQLEMTSVIMLWRHYRT